MLAEMGIRVFEPLARQGAPDRAAAAVRVRHAEPASQCRVGRRPRMRRQGPCVRARCGPSAAGRGAAIELMQWDALAQAVAECRACRLCEGRRNTVFGVGDTAGRLADRGRGPRRERGPAGRAVRRARPASCWTTCSRPWGWTGSARSTSPTSSSAARRPTATRQPRGSGAVRAVPAPPGRSCCSPGSSWPWGDSPCSRCSGSNEPIGKLRGRVHQLPRGAGGGDLPPGLSAAQPGRQGQGLGRPVPGPGLDAAVSRAEPGGRAARRHAAPGCAPRSRCR